MNASEVIQAIINKEGINPNVFANKIGLSRTQPIYDIINGKIKKISSNYANRILSAFPEYNLVWLLTGEGEMLLDADEKEIMRDVDDVFASFSDVKTVPHVEEFADCGKPNGFDIAILEDKCRRYSIPGLVDCDFTIPARGRSMINRAFPERSIKDGDVIACRKWESRSYVRWGEVYVLSTTEGVVVKQIHPSDKEGCVKCTSFNTEEGFLPYDLPTSEIYDWAIVVGVVSVLNWG